MATVPTLTILIQQTTESPHKQHNTRKLNKRHVNQKERKLFLFARHDGPQTIQSTEKLPE